jgi:hypothetical protein
LSRRPLQPVSGGTVTLWAVVGLVGGWLLHPLADWIQGAAPVVGWIQPAVLALIALSVLGTAWVTWRQVHVHHVRLAPHRAVNRFVFGRTCAMVGALVAGGYAGYAVSWLDYAGDPLAGTRIHHSLLAALCGVGVCVGGILLERACRISDDDDDEPSAPSAV